MWSCRLLGVMIEYDANVVKPAETYLAEKKPVVWFWSRSERNYPHNHPLDVSGHVTVPTLDRRSTAIRANARPRLLSSVRRRQQQQPQIRGTTTTTTTTTQHSQRHSQQHEDGA